MIPLPRWSHPFLLNKPCPNCGAATQLNCIDGIGVREKVPSPEKSTKGNAVLTFDYICPSCKHRTTWHADPDDPEVGAENILLNILETLALFLGRNGSPPRNKVSKSQISNKEFEAFKKKLRSIDSHEDFLDFIGIPREQKKPKKDKKSDGDKNK